MIETETKPAYNGITGTFRDAGGDDAYPVTVTLTNGHSLTGVPFYVDGEETVAISTAYDDDNPKGAQPRAAGVWVDPDVPPTHVALAHIVTARWADA